MVKKVEIRGNLANLLTLIGSLYRNPADAIKEYTANALDRWQESPKDVPCTVDYFLHRDRITISYDQPGMDEREFRAALQRVADSVKPGMTVPQIGLLGIGIFAFNQVGRKCTFFSKKEKSSPTLTVVLRSNEDEAEFDTAPKRESLEYPGMRISIEQLLHDPTKARGPLGVGRLAPFFAGKFDAYLRSGSLHLTVHLGGKSYPVRPREIRLQRIALGFQQVRLPRDPAKIVSCTMWFDPLGKSTVAIRHAKVPIVEDLKAVQAYGLEDPEESVFASGYVKGYIDADFLKPQPARTSFVEDSDWINFLDALDKMIRPALKAEVEELRKERERGRLSKLQLKALEMARDILNLEEFQDLALLGGLRMPRGPKKQTGVSRPGRSKDGGGHGTKPRGPRINVEEWDFTDESPPQKLHSRFLAGKVQINRLNQDFQNEKAGVDADLLAYETLMIGKETIAYNDTSGATNEYLEKLLSFLFEVKRRIGSQAITSERKRGMPRKLVA